MKPFLFAVFLYSVSYIGKTQTNPATVTGKIKDGVTGELLPFAKIALLQNDTVKYVAETDFEGYYKIQNVKPGTYDV
ncbi:MAG TPA: carboxypeptidase-like regulatory domain-containing protein, partial [Flavobacteriales bacterium]|nr:carboxypeptidase-like regulatory domain-containing protein [Flavobacteriales bacterium]